VKTNRSTRRRSGFTLLELLTVIAIIGLMAALIGPNLANFKPNVVAAATQQLLTDVGRARQLAIGQRTTVYMVFVPPGFWKDSSFPGPSSGSLEYTNAYKLLDKQLTGYNFVSLRSAGDQPGRHSPRYLSSWRSLPDGTFIPPQKFSFPNQYSYSLYTNKMGATGLGIYADIYGFATNSSIPFPTEISPAINGRWTTLSCIAFNYLGQLVDPNTGILRNSDELIPVAKGSVAYPRDSVTHTNIAPALPNAIESPLGNSVTNSFTVVQIERLTGRARVKRLEVK